jgi:hypothetical protein
MALLNRPLTEDEARKLAADWREAWPKIPSFYDMVVEAMNEPAPHKVVYNGRQAIYVPPDCYYFGPSDCEWIVPGTHKKGF